ncbi:ABC transporter substrate-binding protein [Proteus penneri]|uniref:Phosphoglycerate transport regulatory protein PgtC n=1 Tax=Proteus penneri TaxID=102862 RepID=A0A0G4QDE5_9GAMM|nr:ABC transporter substrate-binding protein [Proteus penneri]CRL63606.1 Phosphoglycerate transport regulatory protein PgtC precursor [Proteus penneri]
MRIKITLSLVCLLFSWLFITSVKSDERPLVILTTLADAPMRPLMAAFNERYPDTKLQVIFRRMAIATRMMKQYPTQPVDIVMSSSANFFHHLDREGLLTRLPVAHEAPKWLTRHSDILNDKVATIGYSGIGIMSNVQYLQKWGIPAPKSWEDMTDPIYQGHLTMTTPANSGTMQLMVENVLQEYGWEKGWQILLETSGNLSSISARSSRVSDAIARGIVGAGPIIDNYAFNHQKHFDYVKFSYFDNSIILPAYVAIVAESSKREKAAKFIEFLLSDEGQEIIYKSDMAKIPLSKTVLKSNDELANNTDFILNSNQAYRRNEVVNVLFDQMITHNFPLMKQTWNEIHEAEKQENKTPARILAINEARALASKVIISEEEANSPLTQALFTKEADQREYSDQALALLYQWRTQVNKNLESALTLLHESKSP